MSNRTWFLKAILVESPIDLVPKTAPKSLSKKLKNLLNKYDVRINQDSLNWDLLNPLDIMKTVIKIIWNIRFLTNAIKIDILS